MATVEDVIVWASTRQYGIAFVADAISICWQLLVGMANWCCTLTDDPYGPKNPLHTKFTLQHECPVEVGMIFRNVTALKLPSVRRYKPTNGSLDKGALIITGGIVVSVDGPSTSWILNACRQTQVKCCARIIAYKALPCRTTRTGRRVSGCSRCFLEGSHDVVEVTGAPRLARGVFCRCERSVFQGYGHSRASPKTVQMSVSAKKTTLQRLDLHPRWNLAIKMSPTAEPRSDFTTPFV